MIDSATGVMEMEDLANCVGKRVRSKIKLDIGEFGCVRPGHLGLVKSYLPAAPQGRVLEVIFPKSLIGQAGTTAFHLRPDQVDFD